jgi:hypothetical protein
MEAELKEELQQKKITWLIELETIGIGDNRHVIFETLIFLYGYIFFLWLIDIESLNPYGEKILKKNCTTFIILNKENLIHQIKGNNVFPPYKTSFLELATHITSNIIKTLKQSYSTIEF